MTRLSHFVSTSPAFVPPLSRRKQEANHNIDFQMPALFTIPSIVWKII